MRFKSFAELDDFYVTEENAYEAIKAIRPTTKASGSSSSNAELGSSRSSRGGSSRSRRGGNASSSSGSRGEIVRYIPIKFNNLPKKNEPAKTERIYKNNLYFSYRQPSYSASAR